MREDLHVVLKVDVPPDAVSGDVDDGYGPVADAFRRNFAERGEIGAACAVYRDGRKVVDLRGGYRDGITRAAWLEDTMVPMFSTTKGVASMAAAYVKPFPRFRFGSPAGLAFGTPGAGGSFAFADPDVGVGFAYAMNRTGFRLYDDPRDLALRDALYRSL